MPAKGMTSFTARVLAVVRTIPKGSVLSYGQVAFAAGRPGAARAVGTIMKRNSDPNVPCHRVIRADGSVGEYNGLQGEKVRLLKAEGWLG